LEPLRYHQEDNTGLVLLLKAFINSLMMMMILEEKVRQIRLGVVPLLDLDQQPLLIKILIRELEVVRIIKFVYDLFFV